MEKNHPYFEVHSIYPGMNNRLHLYYHEVKSLVTYEEDGVTVADIPPGGTGILPVVITHWKNYGPLSPSSLRPTVACHDALVGASKVYPVSRKSWDYLIDRLTSDEA